MLGSRPGVLRGGGQPRAHGEGLLAQMRCRGWGTARDRAPKQEGEGRNTDLSP